MMMAENSQKELDLKMAKKYQSAKSIEVNRTLKMDTNQLNKSQLYVTTEKKATGNFCLDEEPTALITLSPLHSEPLTENQTHLRAS